MARNTNRLERLLVLIAIIFRYKFPNMCVSYIPMQSGYGFDRGTSLVELAYSSNENLQAVPFTSFLRRLRMF